jgi:hypothetical protein
LDRILKLAGMQEADAGETDPKRDGEVPVQNRKGYKKIAFNKDGTHTVTDHKGKKTTTIKAKGIEPIDLSVKF